MRTDLTMATDLLWVYMSWQPMLALREVPLRSEYVEKFTGATPCCRVLSVPLHLALTSLRLLRSGFLMPRVLNTWWTVGLIGRTTRLLQCGMWLSMLQRRRFLSILLVKHLWARQALVLMACVDSLGRVPLMTTLWMLGTRNTVVLPFALLVMMILLVVTFSCVTS